MGLRPGENIIELCRLQVFLDKSVCQMRRCKYFDVSCLLLCVHGDLLKENVLAEIVTLVYEQIKKKIIS